MKRDLFLATFSEHAIDIIQEYGIGIEFNQFCISVSLDDGKREKVIRAMEKQMAKCGITDPRYALVHGPFTEIIPCAIDPMALEYARTRYDQAYRGTRAVGLNRLVVHTGFIPEMYFPVWQVKQTIKFWEKQLEEMDDDFTVYIENVLDPEPEPIIDIVKGLGDPRLRICLDVGHANAVHSSKDIYEWIRLMGPYIGHFHLHNNDGTYDQHRPVMEGTIDMERVLKEIDDHCSPQVTLTVESRDAKSSIPWLLERLV